MPLNGAKKYKHKILDFDKERSGEIPKLSDAARNLLERDTNVHKFGITYGFKLDGKNHLAPSFVHQIDDH